MTQGIQQQGFFQATQPAYPSFDAVFANMEGGSTLKQLRRIQIGTAAMKMDHFGHK
jgi:hypothetical protein